MGHLRAGTACCKTVPPTMQAKQHPLSRHPLRDASQQPALLRKPRPCSRPCALHIAAMSRIPAAPSTQSCHVYTASRNNSVVHSLPPHLLRWRCCLLRVSPRSSPRLVAAPQQLDILAVASQNSPTDAPVASSSPISNCARQESSSVASPYSFHLPWHHTHTHLPALFGRRLRARLSRARAACPL